MLAVVLAVVAAGAASGDGGGRRIASRALPVRTGIRDDQLIRHAAPGSVSPATGGSPAPPSSAPLPRRLGVDEKEYSVYPTHNPVGTGSVEFNVTNFGMDAHDFSIRTGGGTVISSTPVASGQTTIVTVDLQPGTYTLFCSLSDHESLGMHASLQVK
jgi:plastocyanin